ncbi:hypothetical protein [Micromonospora sp. MH33]|uniref:hypothetical protein n=1 Tax=Micromonospora sp. MH33 TaxID=1945509 RepID=UPI0011B1D0DA|nr:hypothetical protein [Micromonospora sp. MH33]
MEADAYIPLKVSFDVTQGGQPLYLRLRGELGGEAELKIDPVSGALVQVTVIDPPPEVDHAPAATSTSESENCVPVLDRYLWPWKRTPDYEEPVRRVIHQAAHLGMSGNQQPSYVEFSTGRAVGSYRCGPVVFGVSAQEELVNMVILSGER